MFSFLGMAEVLSYFVLYSCAEFLAYFAFYPVLPDTRGDFVLLTFVAVTLICNRKAQDWLLCP